jgi:hypothetical protein
MLGDLRPGGVDLKQLVAVDRMPIAATLGAAPVGSTWRRLANAEDLDLDLGLNRLRDRQPGPLVRPPATRGRRQ